MKIVTWNVNGIRARHVQLNELVAAESPDVICLQEIKAPPDKVPDLLGTSTDHWCYWHGSGGYSGVALLVRHSFFMKQPTFSHPYFDMEYRIVVGDLGPLAVASVYVPNGGKDYDAKIKFFTSFCDWAEATVASGRDVIICGDLNIAREERDVHPKERKPNQIGARPEERALFTRLLGTGLVDVVRTMDPGNNELFTIWEPWRNLRQRTIGWRIEYLLATPGVADRARSSPSRREFATSDPAPVEVDYS